MLENDVLRGAQRNYYSVRIIALCVASAVMASAAVAFIATLLITSNTRGTIYDNAVAGCERSNQVRQESNRRIAQHALDASNLRRLATRLSVNRGREAATFAAIGGAFNIERKVDPLVSILRDASSEDKEIADSQATVAFTRLPLIDCHDKHVIPRP